MPAIPKQTAGETIRKMVAVQANKPIGEVTRDRKLLDVGLDSLDAVELLLDIEEEFGFRVPDSDLDQMVSWTVRDLIKYVRERRA